METENLPREQNSKLFKIAKGVLISSMIGFSGGTLGVLYNDYQIYSSQNARNSSFYSWIRETDNGGRKLALHLKKEEIEKLSPDAKRYVNNAKNCAYFSLAMSPLILVSIFGVGINRDSS